MDIGELLAYKPETGLKHTLDDDDEELDTGKKSKKLQTSGPGSNARKRSRLTGVSQKSLKALVPPSPSRVPPPTPPRGIPPPTPPRNIPPPTPPRWMHNQQQRKTQAKSVKNLKDLAPPSTEENECPVAPEQSSETENEEVEEVEAEESESPLDEAKIKQLVLSFDKRRLKNQELRIKFPEDPRKFMESELELHDAIEELHSVSVVPQLYSVLLNLGLHQRLLSLLSHDNSDIAAAVLGLLQEMTTLDGVDVEDEEQDGLDALIAALVDADILSALVHNLHRTDDVGGLLNSSNPLIATATTEAQAVHDTLGIIENLFEVRPSLSSSASSSGLLSWLLKRLRAKMIFEPNKLYASEILAICVQGSENNRQLLGESEGIDILLQQLAVYKRHDPSTSEEQELMENLFDVLCACLLYAPNRDYFLRGEGLQLMNLMLREKKLSRNGAVKVLDHALTGHEGTDCCNKFIDILGLRTIFPLFMKTPKKHGKKGLSIQEHEGHILSIIHWLLRNCKANQKQRLMSKFLENDHEKVDRLMELHFSYLEKVMATDRQLEKQQRLEDEPLDEDEMYLRRLDGGLFTLQLVDYIMLCICATGPPAIKRRVVKILNLRNASVKTIKNIIREYVSNLGDDSTLNNDDLSDEQQRVLDWLDKFQNM